MYADKPITGVGGGNFASYYPHYKIPSAPETVRDPHNFILSLLTQYGPFGLIGFLVAFLVPLYKTIFKNPTTHPPKPGADNKLFSTLFAFALFFICAALLIFRPIVMADKLGDQLSVIVSVAIILYVAPVCIFAFMFWLLAVGEKAACVIGRSQVDHPGHPEADGRGRRHH